jgi:DNA-binding IclR family transcriptional regulator/sugar lactone lactonase YvrE
MSLSTIRNYLERQMKQTNGTNLLLKAISILDFISQSDSPPRLKDVVEATMLPPGTAHRILDTLIAEGFLRRSMNDRTFRIGPRFLQMARGAWEDYDIRAAAVPELDRLQRELGQTVTLSAFADDALILIDRRKSRDALRSTLGIGSALPLHGSASGKAVLSAFDSEKISAVPLPRMTPNTITDTVVLTAHLEMAASNHFAIDDEESAIGLRGCAAAILDQAGRPLGALSFSGPADVISVARCREVGPILANAAERVSWNLGFNPPDRWAEPERSLRAKTVEQVGSAVSFVGTNPLWSERRDGLFWSDRTAPALRFNGADGQEKSYGLPGRAQCLVERDHGLRMVLPDGLYDLDLTTGSLERIGSLFDDHLNLVCVNGIADARGRIWLTMMDRTLSRATGGIYRIDRDHSVKRVVGGLLMPLGIAWSPDNSLIYYSDGPKREIYCARFDIDTGGVGEQLVFARLKKNSGRPTGLAVDAEGHIWNTQSEGWRLVRYSPTGEVDQVVELPIPRPLDCSFGGPDLRTLYITSTRLGIPERQLRRLPLSGALLSYRAAVPGCKRI